MKKELYTKINLIHTTTLGEKRIKKNTLLKDPVNDIKEIIKDEKSQVIKQGKNYYVNYNNLVITINSYSYTIITAHIKKENYGTSKRTMD